MSQDQPTVMIKSILGASLLLNVMIAFMLLGGVRTNPADVKKQLDIKVIEIQAEQSKLKFKLEQVYEKVLEINTHLKERTELISVLIDELPERTRDRIYRREIEQWAENIKALNPDMHLPPIPQIVNAVANPPSIKVEK
jgi:peptidoglycan hydrolase CwlO-like protein